ncbi:hypothetical protein V5799_002665 [Amblyomma americanum]|uniref:Peptidase S54 rhomboid domain-containing protein n=1 Tax=Amblyomma americanum TaxID=6943 RepID=A0AAQ4DB61_AMBAM
MSQQGSDDHATVVNKDDQGGGVSTTDAAVADATHTPEPSATAGVPDTGTAPSSDTTAIQQPHSSQPLDSGALGASANSVAVTENASPSLQQASEAAAPIPEVTKLRSEQVTEACQTPQPTAVAYRSLTLQFSPGKQRHLPRSSSKLRTSTTSSEPGTPDGLRSPMSPRSVETSPLKFRPLGRLLDIVSAVSSNVLSSTRETRGQEEPSREYGVVSSPRALMPRSETPKRLATKPGTPVAATGASSPPSRATPPSVATPAVVWPSTLGEGTAIHSPNTAIAYERYVPPRIPWVTLLVMCLQVRAHWMFSHKHYSERCASVRTILLDGHWERALFAAFHHADAEHLLSSLLSFLPKALILEAALGATHFASLFVKVAVLVGVVNSLVVRLISQFPPLSVLRTTCTHTFAGVIAVFELLIRTHFGRATIHYGNYQLGIRSPVVMVVELLLLHLCSNKNDCPIVSGLLVGTFLAKTSLGNFITRTKLCRSFLILATGLLLGVNALLDGLSWIAWRHLVAFQDDLPPPVRHSSTCSCALVGALLAMKVIHHRRHPHCEYHMACFSIYVPFWTGVLLELTLLHLEMPDGHTLGHVTGILLGLVVNNCRKECFANFLPRVLERFLVRATPEDR